MAHASPGGPAETNRRVGAQFLLAVSAFGALTFVFVSLAARQPTTARYEQGKVQFQVQRCEASVRAQNLGETPACLQIRNTAVREKAISEGLGGLQRAANGAGYGRRART
jgi:hypothetical protein